MEDMERDAIILKKVLNSKLFLNKFPVIDRVDVSLYGYGGIDIFLTPNDIKQYWIDKKEIYPFIWDIATMAGVTSRLSVYP
jgi:hypothetical protein